MTRLMSLPVLAFELTLALRLIAKGVAVAPAKRRFA
jgi:hypothetical protein